ncbi:non-specific lipid-transfer protein-like protein At2g13820 isoform X1 [Quercus lobata]|uniref:non-specific lipid-transfer protein-like protein At2g13820 isoform X1 n=1 Tax=Quercus lobata TaxID=97700 RepID=UPI0012480582|nr:non-specific lipid-transfer protein-like protein At2g13820 isoform X1 [Quercus lobata]
MKRVFIFTCFLFTSFLIASSDLSPSESPYGGCSDLIWDLVDCMSYLSDESEMTKPGPDCCTAFELTMNIDASCIIEATKIAPSYDINLNVTRVMMMPEVCRDVSLPPESTPVEPPMTPSKPSSPAPKSSAKSTPVTPSSKTPSPTFSSSTGGGVPASSPLSHSGTYSTTVSFGVLVSMLIALLEI